MLTSFLSWVLRTVTTAAEAEMNDDTALRERLLEAEMQREMGEISDEEFRDVEAELLARIREIRERREGGAGPLTMGGAQPIETTADSRYAIEASVTGDFHEPAEAPHTMVTDLGPGYAEQVSVLDLDQQTSPRARRPRAAGRRPRRSRRPRSTGP